MVRGRQSAVDAPSNGNVPGVARVAALIGAFMELGTRPPASLDPLIDATERAVSRYGIRRTSMSDLAREMNVARTTLYRQVDSVDEAIGLVGARGVHHFLDEWSDVMVGGDDWWGAFVGAVVRAIETTTANPLFRRLFDHEPEVVGEFLVQGGLNSIVIRLGEVAQPMLGAAVEAGSIADVDSRLASEHMARSIVSVMITPPSGDLRETVEFMLAPLRVEQVAQKG